MRTDKEIQLSPADRVRLEKLLVVIRRHAVAP